MDVPPMLDHRVRENAGRGSRPRRCCGRAPDQPASDLAFASKVGVVFGLGAMRPFCGSSSTITGAEASTVKGVRVA